MPNKILHDCCACCCAEWGNGSCSDLRMNLPFVSSSTIGSRSSEICFAYDRRTSEHDIGFIFHWPLSAILSFNGIATRRTKNCMLNFMAHWNQQIWTKFVKKCDHLSTTCIWYVAQSESETHNSKMKSAGHPADPSSHGRCFVQYRAKWLSTTVQKFSPSFVTFTVASIFMQMLCGPNGSPLRASIPG